ATMSLGRPVREPHHHRRALLRRVGHLRIPAPHAPHISRLAPRTEEKESRLTRAGWTRRHAAPPLVRRVAHDPAPHSRVFYGHAGCSLGPLRVVHECATLFGFRAPLERGR